MIGLLIVAGFVVPIAIAAVALRLVYEFGQRGGVPRGMLIVGGFIIAGLLGLEAAIIQTAIGAIAAKL